MGNTSTKVAHQEKYELPSKGLFYSPEDGIPSEFVLRSMTTREEKLRLSSSGSDVMPKIIEACTMNVDGFNSSVLKLADLQFLMYKLRVVTYGPDYNIELRCPNCGESFKTTVDLDDIPIKYADDNMVEPFEIGPLPVSKDILKCRLIDPRDMKNMELESRKIKQKFPDYQGNPEFILQYQYKIEEINGERVPSLQIRDYVENMAALDMRYFDAAYSEIEDSFGMDLDMLEVCPRCSSDVEFRLPVTTEFFRPSIDLGKWKAVHK